MGKPAYEAYYQESMNHADLNNFISAMNNAESEEQKKEIYNALTSEQRKVVDEFFNGEQSKQIIEGLANASAVALKNIAVFESVDTSALLKQVKFTDLMSEKDKLSLTADQISYLKDSVFRSYSLYQTLAALDAAQ